MNRTTLLAAAAFAIAAPAACAESDAIHVASLAELARAAAQSGQTVVMKPGLYRLIDELPPATMTERRRQGEFQFLTFKGNDNTFRLSGVTIEVDTALRAALRPPIHTDEFLVAGDNNAIEGLTITNIGDGTSLGGAVLGVVGRGNTLRNCTIHVRGSFPYGYGDLFGKGGPNVIAPRKKSGVHITGRGTTLIGCKLFMRSFGHGFYVQDDADDVRFENCLVEGELRATDDILAETSGPAVQAGFRTVAVNRQGEHRVTPGYMKSLAEDGFRTYGKHKNLVLKNCTARNMRGGFELRTPTGALLENCAAEGNERGFWVSSDAVVRRCRGDARHGPLLFVEGDNASIELELLPDETSMNVHALAIVAGRGHEVTITASPRGPRSRPLPILIGFAPPGMGEGMSPIFDRDARNIALRNETTMPVVVGPKASDSQIAGIGPIAENKGRGIAVTRLDPPAGDR